MQKLLSLAAALVALTLADTAHAVLTPALPGWSVRVVASGFPTLAPDAFAVDPVSGDLFAITVGGDPPTLIRVHSNGTVTTLASLASVGRGIAFDAVARILYVHGHTIIYRYSESGSLLGTLPISNTTASFALGPDRRLYSIQGSTGEYTLPLNQLQVAVLDEVAGAWLSWRPLALGFDLFVPNGDLIDIAFDGSGRVLAEVDGHVYRADASSTTLLHSALLQEDLAAGNSLLLAGPLLLDAAGGSQSGQAFVDGSALLQNLAVVSDDFVYAGDDGTIYAFTRSTGPVRGVRSTWSAVKARFH